MGQKRYIHEFKNIHDGRFEKRNKFKDRILWSQFSGRTEDKKSI
jgi:hypothetical protein